MSHRRFSSKSRSWRPRAPNRREPFGYVSYARIEHTLFDEPVEFSLQITLELLFGVFPDRPPESRHAQAESDCAVRVDGRRRADGGGTSLGCVWSACEGVSGWFAGGRLHASEGLKKSLAWHLASLISAQDLGTVVEHLSGAEGVDLVLRAASRLGADVGLCDEARSATAALRACQERCAGSRSGFIALLGSVSGEARGRSSLPGRWTRRPRSGSGLRSWGGCPRVRSLRSRPTRMSTGCGRST